MHLRPIPPSVLVTTSKNRLALTTIGTMTQWETWHKQYRWNYYEKNRDISWSVFFVHGIICPVLLQAASRCQQKLESEVSIFLSMVKNEGNCGKCQYVCLGQMCGAFFPSVTTDRHHSVEPLLSLLSHTLDSSTAAFVCAVQWHDTELIFL